MSKRALIVGVTGQDGAYLAQLLLNKDMKFLGLHVMQEAHRSTISRYWVSPTRLMLFRWRLTIFAAPSRLFRKWRQMKFTTCLVRARLAFIRPSDIQKGLASPARAKTLLDWEAKIAVEEVIEQLVSEELRHYAAAGRKE